jgi:hypothetical protein
MALPNAVSSAQQIVYATGVASSLVTPWLYDPSIALQADPAVYEKLLRDCTISGAYDHLQRSIVGHSVSYEPRDPKNPRHRLLSAVLEDLTRETDDLAQSFYNLSRARFMGATWALLVPERRLLAIGDDKPRWWTVIARVRDIDKRRFRIARVGSPQAAGELYGGRLGPPPEGAKDPQGYGGAPSAGTGGGEPARWRWEFHRGPSFWWEPLENCAPPDRWIQFVPDTSERGLAYGFGQADDLYEYFWIKQQILRFWTQGLERWGQGFLYASIDNLSNYAKARGVPLATALQQTVNEMRKWRSENLAAVDKGVELKLLDLPSAANEACITGVQYLDAELTKAILSALQPTGGNAGSGSYSSSKVEEGSTDTAVAYFRALLEQRWTATYARFLVEHNQDNLAELGLERLRASTLRLRGKEQRDIETMLKVYEFCAARGVPVRRSEFYETTQLTPPNDEDGEGDVLRFENAPAQGAGQDRPGLDLEERGNGLRAPVGDGGEAVGENAHRNGSAARVA